MEMQEADLAIDEASLPYEGKWNRLVSTTNWEKGRIVYEWRIALKQTDVPPTEFSDEAWSRRVGGVTGQHIGRLRRVYERFGEVHTQYERLFWSHFQASLDWDDAEMWLEGAVQESWSVAKMRKARWEALGAPEELRPRDEDIISTETDEDLDTREDLSPSMTDVDSSFGEIDDPRSPAGPDFGEEDDFSASGPTTSETADSGDGSTQVPVPFVRPFESIGDLPEDLAEASESFKLCIARHRAEGWKSISQAGMLEVLDALKAMANAEPAPF